MGIRIKKSELSNGTIKGMISALEKDMTETEGLITAIDSFISEISSKKNLSGESYTKVKNKLSEYRNVLTSKRISAASELIAAINSATGKMQGYMEGYDTLDTDKLDSLNQSLSQAQNTIDSINEKASSEMTPEALEESKKQISYARIVINTLSKEIEKIEQLATTDDSAYATIESAKAKISEYSSAINGLQESTIVSL